MKIALIETSHAISQTVMRSITQSTGWDLYNVQNAPNLHRYDAVIAYGILRGTAEIMRSRQHWFEIDKGLYGAGHYDGNYRISYRATQPIYRQDSLKANEIDVSRPGYTMVCPPTEHVCEFFGIDRQDWIRDNWDHDNECLVRTKGDQAPMDWAKIGRLVTFNSSLGFEALKRDIPVISDPVHSTIGSYYKNSIQPNMNELLSFCDEHHFSLSNGGKICRIVESYLRSG